MKALLIIDVQENLMTRKLYNKDRFIASINSAIKQCRTKNYQIIFMQHNNKFLIQGEFDWQIYSHLDQEKNDVILQKTQSNAFQENDFITLCDNRNINEFFVCGLVSHGCIRATCLGGIKQGHTIKLLKDGHSNWAKDAKDKIAMVEKELRKEKIEITDRID